MSDAPIERILPQNTPVIIVGFGPPVGSARYNPFFAEPVRVTVIRLPEPFHPPQPNLAFIGTKGARLYAMPTKRMDRFGATLTLLLEDKNYVTNAFEQLDGDCGDDPEYRHQMLAKLKLRAMAEVEAAFRLHGDKIFPHLT